MAKKVLIIGSGRVGCAIGYYLKEKGIKAALFGNELFQDFGLEFIKGTISDQKVHDLIKEANLIVGALPGRIAKHLPRLALQYKKPLVDVSDLDFEDYWPLKRAFKSAKIAFIPECGFSPGLSNLLTGYSARSFDKVESVAFKVGTLTKKSFYFPVCWSPQDLIREHSLDAVVIKNYKAIKLPPFSDYVKESYKDLEFESYLCDGLGSLLHTIKAKNMEARTIRPLGFYHFYSFLKNTNCFEEVISSLAKNQVEDFSLLLLEVKGYAKGKPKEKHWNVEVERDNLFNSIQKPTALMASTAAQMLLEGKISYYDILPLEELAKNTKLVKAFLNELSAHGISISQS